jgi:hypothetical protein
METPFNNPLVNDIRKIINEATTSKVLSVNGKAAKTLDFSENLNDPDVYVFGMGTLRLSNLKKMAVMDARKVVDMIASDNAQYGKILESLGDVDGKRSSLYLAYRLMALTEVQEYMKRPEVKRKISLMKK